MDMLTTDWKRFPEGGRVDRQVFAVTDVHGRADLLGGLLDYIEKLPVRAERVIVFTGDIVDRGPDAIGAYRLVMDAENRFEERILLPGNHEQMMLDALINPLENMNLQFWYKIGGHALVEQVGAPLKASIPEIAQAVRQALPQGLEEMLLRAPSHHVEDNLLFVHAGLLPGGDQKNFLSQKLFDHAPDNLHWAWIRDPFLEWTMGWEQTWDRKGKTVVVHGHTVEIGKRHEEEAALLAAMDKVDSHRRINLDIGAHKFGQLAALEAAGDRYRFHVAHDSWLSHIQRRP